MANTPVTPDAIEPIDVLAEFQASLAPLIAFRDAHLDLGMYDEIEEGSLHFAAVDLDVAFDSIDSALQWLESDAEDGDE
jgi:hypothetical protein